MVNPRRRSAALSRLEKRSQEGLQIYRPMPPESSDQLRVHTSQATELLVTGGNRAGKTLAVAAEIASAALGLPIIGPDGEPLPMAYPVDGPLRIWFMGINEEHIGNTLYRMLFTSDHGLLMIRDEVTDKWRAFRPNDPADEARRDQAKRAGPLIPERFIDKEKWAWKDKRQRAFSRCVLKPKPEWGLGEDADGTEICAFSSHGECPMGVPVHVVWIDEDLVDGKYYPELRMRVIDYDGRVIWSSYPRQKVGGTEAYMDLMDRAEAQKERADPDVELIRLTQSQNVYLSEESKRKARESLSEEELAARDYGEIVMETILMYPMFNDKFHSVEIDNVPNPQGPNDRITEILEKCNWQPPKDWMRLMIHDPGYTQNATLFAAMPPLAYGDVVYFYNELYPKNVSADAWGEMAKYKIGQDVFDAFIIDYHGSIGHGVGHDTRAVDEYVRALACRSIRSMRTGSGFVFGSGDTNFRQNRVREWLMTRADGTTKFRYLRRACPNLRMEFRKYRRQVTTHGTLDKAIKKFDHLMNCAEYAAAYDPVYNKPDPSRTQYSPAYRNYLDKMEAMGQEGGSVHFGAGLLPKTDNEADSTWQLRKRSSD